MVSGTNDNIADTFSFICTSKHHGVVHAELFFAEGVKNVFAEGVKNYHETMKL